MERIDERIHKARLSAAHAFGWIGALIFAVAGVGGWQFAIQTDLRSMLFWDAGTIIASLWLGMIKLWIWMELQRFWLCPPEP